MTPQFSQQLESLACAAVVLRGRVGASEDVVDLVSSFLDFAIPERWSIDRACEKGFGLRMLKRLAVHEASDEASGTASSVDPFYRAYLASKGLVAAINRADDVDVVRWICCEYCPTVVPVHAMGEAAAHGRLRVLQWLFDKYSSVRPNTFVADKAAEGGHLDVLQWVLSHIDYLPIESVNALLRHATLRGDGDMVRWIRENRCRMTDGADNQEGMQCQFVLGIAILNGHLELAKYLADAGYTLDPSQMQQLSQCASRGDLEMIKWVHEQEFVQEATGWIDLAASAGHLDIIKWVHENFPGDSCSTEAMNNAAKNGHLEVVQWLHANRTEGCSTDAMDEAAINGRIEIVQWLHEHRTEGCTTSAMDYAAANGSLEIVQFLHANRTEGCTTTAMDIAASNGHLQVVQWLHAHRSEGCTSNAMAAAAADGHLAVVQWLHENRTEGCTTNAMDYAAANGRLEVVKWLHANRTEGCTDFAMDRAAGGGHLETVQWLHENRTEGCAGYTMESAARNGHLDVMKWLHANREEGHSEYAMYEASSVQMLQWLHEHEQFHHSIYPMMNAVQVGNFEKLLFLKEKNLGDCDEDVVFEALKTSNFEIFQWLRANYPDRYDFDAVKLLAVGAPWEWRMFFEFEREMDEEG